MRTAFARILTVHREEQDVRSYSMSRGLELLHEELTLELESHEANEKKSRSWRHWFQVFHHNSVRSLFHWTTVLLTLVLASALIASYAFSESKGNIDSIWILIEAFIFIVCIIFNIAINIHKDIHERYEFIKIVREILKKLEDCMRYNTWNKNYFPRIESPLSPCYSLQWTIRDGTYYNIPTPLLVKGDIILLRPGHKAPAKCKQLQTPAALMEEDILEEDEVYCPDDTEKSDVCNQPKGREVKHSAKFMLLETPYVKYMRQLFLDKHRPPSVVEHEKYTVLSVWIERRILPVVLLVMFVTNIVRLFHLKGHVGHWTEMLLTLQVHAMLPLLPLIIPAMYLLINFYGQARVFTAFEAGKGSKSLGDDSFDICQCVQAINVIYFQSLGDDSFDTGQCVQAINVIYFQSLGDDSFDICQCVQAINVIYFQSLGDDSFDTGQYVQAINVIYFQSLGDDSFDTDSSISADEARVDLPWRLVLDWFKCIVLGHVTVLTRRINITHILGSVTSLCCVDKKGILSYPNPTPEKIFFLRRGHHEMKHQTSVTTSESDTNEEPDVTIHNKQSDHSDPSTWVEVLDVTSDPKTSFSIQFDDPSWNRHLSSLKPLGLTILANTCNLETARWYTQFTDHVACAGLQNEETVAVVNRRCLCALAREIGFSENAMDIFTLEKTLGMYRQVSAEMTTKERLQRAKSFIQHKIPMPNMVSVVLREKVSGTCQLLSQGTADILLSCCTDFWDGKDLSPLTQTERKKILDFYHRTSIGSYCTAFSYCPVRHSLIGHLSDMYIELPDDSHCMNLATSMASMDKDLELLSEAHGSWEFPRSFSADSLLDSTSIRSTEDEPGSILQSQCNQVFIGMVTMQYQARQEFIQLIDKLEGACIRFVHFSQENEVRSRVFAEKMGLEAGWNCHISLRSEEQYLSGTSANVSMRETSQVDLSHRMSSRQSTVSVAKGDKPVLSKIVNKLRKPVKSRSFSAPSIVNLGSSQVKFESHVQTAIVSPRKLKPSENVDDVETLSQEDSYLLQFQEFQGNKIFNFEQQDDDDINDPSTWVSEEDLSRQTSSYITENTEDSLEFDNRAKLPRGIENIRPHLENIDNVPLLVNLFTDCTPETTCEMFRIMQENGEVVLCVGSSINMQNIPLFLQADCSLALEAFYPQMCVKQQAPGLLWDKDVETPLQLASSLLCVMSPIMISKDDNISLIHLIAEARSQLMSMRNCFYFMMCCSLSVTLAQVMASILLLPPILQAQHTMWLSLVIIPLLGLTMMGNPVDARVMSLATRKNSNHITSEMILQFIVYYVMRFIPPVLVAMACYCFTLHSYCQTTSSNNVTASCGLYDVLSTTPDTSKTWLDNFSGGLVLAQNIFIFLLVLYFEIISLSFVHWNDHLWQQFPATNKLWLIIVPLLLCSQVIFSICDTYIRSYNIQKTISLFDIHPAIWAVGLTFPIIMVAINELVKHREIKLAVRSQKRARLDFGTKLGMNSPF
ncbi:hypothetical protein ACF0H5_001831 [Mactra antiquata]